LLCMKSVTLHHCLLISLTARLEVTYCLTHEIYFSCDFIISDFPRFSATWCHIINSDSSIYIFPSLLYSLSSHSIQIKRFL
jgi:hypothetical protein